MFDNVDRVVDPDFTLVYEEGLDGLLRSLTVSQFKQQTNNMARSLSTMGCEPGDKVAHLHAQPAGVFGGYLGPGQSQAGTCQCELSL